MSLFGLEIVAGVAGGAFLGSALAGSSGAFVGAAVGLFIGILAARD